MVGKGLGQSCSISGAVAGKAMAGKAVAGKAMEGKAVAGRGGCWARWVVGAGRGVWVRLVGR